MTKESREIKIANLAKNLEIILNNSNRKFLALTTDTDSYNVMPLINEITNVYLSMGRKVAILSYDDITKKIENAGYFKLNINDYNDTTIIDKCENYDIVLIDAPNPLKTKHYLHLTHFCKDAVLVVKKWKSKVSNVEAIKEIAKDNDFNFLGVVYQN